MMDAVAGGAATKRCKTLPTLDDPWLNTVVRHVAAYKNIYLQAVSRLLPHCLETSRLVSKPSIEYLDTSHISSLVLLSC